MFGQSPKNDSHNDNIKMVVPVKAKIVLAETILIFIIEKLISVFQVFFSNHTWLVGYLVYPSTNISIKVFEKLDTGLRKTH